MENDAYGFRGRDIKKRLMPKVERSIEQMRRTGRETGRSQHEIVSFVATRVTDSVNHGIRRYKAQRTHYRRYGRR